MYLLLIFNGGFWLGMLVYPEGKNAETQRLKTLTKPKVLNF